LRNSVNSIGNCSFLNACTYFEGLEEVFGRSFRLAHEEDLQTLLAETLLHDFGPICRPFATKIMSRKPLICSVLALESQLSDGRLRSKPAANQRQPSLNMAGWGKPAPKARGFGGSSKTTSCVLCLIACG
jgi:hypothetical protein